MELLHDKRTQPAKELQRLSIVRTIGTDDVLAAALLWELWQRGVNRKLVYKDLLVANIVQSPRRVRTLQALCPGCADGLVLISEWDSEYARALSRNLSEGFQARCRAGGETTSAVRWFTYLRGLDGILPDIDKTSANVPRKDEGIKQRTCALSLRTRRRNMPRDVASTTICDGSAMRSPGSMATHSSQGTASKHRHRWLRRVRQAAHSPGAAHAFQGQDLFYHRPRRALPARRPERVGT